MEMKPGLVLMMDETGERYQWVAVEGWPLKKFAMAAATIELMTKVQTMLSHAAGPDGPQIEVAGEGLLKMLNRRNGH